MVIGARTIEMSLSHVFSKKRCREITPDGCNTPYAERLKVFLIHGGESDTYMGEWTHGNFENVVTPSPAVQAWRQFCAMNKDAHDDWIVYWIVHRADWNAENQTGDVDDWESNFCDAVEHGQSGANPYETHYDLCPRGAYACSNGSDVRFIWATESMCVNCGTPPNSDAADPDGWRATWPNEDPADYISSIALLIYEDIVENYFGASLDDVPHPDNNMLCTGTTGGSPNCPTAGGEYSPPWEEESIEIVNIVDISTSHPNWGAGTFEGDGTDQSGDNINDQRSYYASHCLEYLFNLHDAWGIDDPNTSVAGRPRYASRRIANWPLSQDDCAVCVMEGKPGMLVTAMRENIEPAFVDAKNVPVYPETHGQYHIGIIVTPCMFADDVGEYHGASLDVSVIEELLEDHCMKDNWLFIVCIRGDEDSVDPGATYACCEEPQDAVDGDLIRILGNADGQLGSLDNCVRSGQSGIGCSICTNNCEYIGCALFASGSANEGEGPYDDVAVGVSTGGGGGACNVPYWYMNTAPCVLHQVYNWLNDKFPSGVEDTDLADHSVVVHCCYTAGEAATNTVSVNFKETDEYRPHDFGNMVATWLGAKFCGFGFWENLCFGPDIEGGTYWTDCRDGDGQYMNWVDAMYEMVSSTLEGGETA